MSSGPLFGLTVAQASGLSLKDVALAARRLSRAGLVTRDRHALTLRVGLFAEPRRYGDTALHLATAGP